MLERKALDVPLSQQDLNATGQVSRATRMKMSRVKGVEYFIACEVSSFEKTSAKGSKSRSKSPGARGNKVKISVAIDVRVIDAETGEIVDFHTIKAAEAGEPTGGGKGRLSSSSSGLKAKNTPTGKGIRACIVYVSDYLECSMVKGKDHACMKKWN